MHQPHTEPRRSIYYDYQVFKPWLPPKEDTRERHGVVIVGAGPIGMTAALELARHGVRCVLLESELQVSEGSRAIVFTRRSMEILQQVGVDARVSANGLPWRFGNSFYRGQRVFRMEAPQDEDDRFWPMINLQQQYLEEYLLDAVHAQPLIELRWGNRVTAVLQHEGVARLQVDTPVGPYQIEADWAVAADGARSPVRQMLGLEMEGASYEGRFVIADIRIALDLPTERLAFFDPVWNPGNTVLMHREPHGIWRVDYQLPPGETPQDALQPESLAARINAQLQMIGKGGTPWELDWCSVYSARAMTLPDYVHGRILFTGDAAHMLPIFGVRGANTGFQDAQALAWKLAFVQKGLAPQALLASYSQERVGAAREIIDEAGKSARFMTPPTRGFRLLRDATLSLSLTQPFVGPLFHWRTSRPHEYRHTPLNSPGDDDRLFGDGPGHGAPLRNVQLAGQGYLLDHFASPLGAALVLMLFTDSDSIPESMQQAVSKARERGLPLSVLALRSAGLPMLDVQGADRTLHDPDGRLWRKYGVRSAGAAYLVRPDQHVCARWMSLEPQRLNAALASATLQTSTAHATGSQP